MIWSAVRQGNTVSCSEDLNCPSETDTRNAPLEMHSGYSVFQIAIAKSDGSLHEVYVSKEPFPVLKIGTQYYIPKKLFDDWIAGK